MARLALKLGCTAFGGPAAHIAMLREEIVTRRGWMSDTYFLDLLAATNLIPGPNSTEMVIHAGYHRAGRRGLVAAGVCFILPAALITLLFAWIYQRYGTTPQLAAVLDGVTPVVLAVIAQAIWGLARTVATQPPLLAVGVCALALSLAGVNEMALLIGLGLLVAISRAWNPGWLSVTIGAIPELRALVQRVPELTPILATTLEPYSPMRLFLEFLKIGATLFGSGYVLVAYVQQEFVANLGWLSERQLLDAVAVGQVTPGPVFSTATFVGYLVGGWGAAILATMAIFVPAFIFVALTHPLVPRLRASPLAGGFLDGVSAAAVGVMAAVTIVLSRSALDGPFSIVLVVFAALLLVRFQVSATWLIVAGAALGLAGLIAGV